MNRQHIHNNRNEFLNFLDTSEKEREREKKTSFSTANKHKPLRSRNTTHLGNCNITIQVTDIWTVCP